MSFRKFSSCFFRDRLTYNLSHCHSHLTKIRGFSLLSKIGDPSRSNKIAIVDSDNQSYTYSQINEASTRLAQQIQETFRLDENKSQNSKTIRTIASFHLPSALYVITSLATWKLGAAVAPLSVSHTQNELEYFLSDSNADLVITTPTLLSKLPINHTIPHFVLTEAIWKSSKDYSSSSSFPFPHDSSKVHKDSNALIIYTSGTTSKPKGVVHTQSSLNHMIVSLTTSWEYHSSDKILHFLPLHHLHGILNKLWCVLYSGGEVEFLKSANSIEIWNRLSDSSRLITLFMAVPTIYAKLLESYSKNDIPKDILQRALQNIKSIRVMVSGSASLPTPILHKWKLLTGHILLERYGMTEVGMALSNPLHGERKEGYVGTPLPFVKCKILPDVSYYNQSHESSTQKRNEENFECGELLLKVNLLKLFSLGYYQYYQL